ncbi:glycosyltransferase [Flavobacterium sp. GP15]|uniref:glycosyltransferase n=1 Tax=Flavobacterium sp. GP15 TaxID=2758567 RepID=UPI00165D5AA4|nr:glycosyltransferase [Flavobacterium sp. GP15]
MRVGTNPRKNGKHEKINYLHQLIIPVYIPNNEGYFSDCFKILQLCLNSLFKTVHSKTFITIVNNGSCEEVVNYLNGLYNNEFIKELIHTSNIGKNNAVLKGLKGHYFMYVTIADADVLFLNGWQNETMKVFNTFPKAGVVGIVPQLKSFSYLCANVLFDNFFSNKLKFTKVINPGGIKHFYKSIGWDNDYNKEYLRYQLTISDSSNCKAVIGSGHFVATYKNEVLEQNLKIKIDEYISSKFDRLLFDVPVTKKGGWRLTTENNFAYHMGNVYEDWMKKVLDDLADESKRITPGYSNFALKSNKLSYFIKNQLFRRFLKNKTILRYFMIKKGLPKDIAQNY